MFYDVHIHSALSPCGDNDMTPNNIVNMAVLKGLNVIALTDHNSCKNCPAIVKAAENSPLTVLCGMEINTAEEIHAVCLFPTLQKALAFDAYVYERLPNIANNPVVFGEQRIYDAQDRIIGYESKLLINACNISIMELSGLMQQFGGICFPAHIEKSSYSITSSLGMVPPECGFTVFEVKDLSRLPQVLALLPDVSSLILHNSDAHYLWDISEAENSVPCSNFWHYLLDTKN